MTNIKGNNSLLLLICSFLFLLVTIFFYKFQIGQDQAMYLYAGNLILKGQKPFVNFFDINPPAIMYLSAISNFLANLVSINQIVFFKCLSCVWCFTLIGLAVWILNTYRLCTSKQSLLVASLIFILMTIQALDFSLFQRDQFFSLALFTYVIQRVGRALQPEKSIPLPIALFIGLSFGLTLTFKPFFLLHFFCFETLLAKNFKNFLRQICSLEVVITVLVIFIFYAYLLLLPQPAWDNFWLDLVPTVIRYYSSFQAEFGELLVTMSLLTLVLAAILIATITGSLKKHSLYIQMLFWNLLIALFIYFLQNKGFVYHLCTINLISIMLAYFIWCEKSYAAKKPVKVLTVFIFLSTFLRLFILFTSFIHPYLPTAEQYVSVFSSVMRLEQTLLKPNDYILPLSPIPFTTYPALNRNNLKLASRYLFQYPLSFYGSQRFKNGKLILKSESTELDRLEQRYAYQLREDIEKYKPLVIYYFEIPEIRQNLPRNFPLGDYLHHLVLTSDVLKKYKFVPGYEPLVVFKRIIN